MSIDSVISMQDVFYYEGGPTTNFDGHSEGLSVYAKAAERESAFLKFGFSALIPAEAIITLATLNLYAHTYASGRTISVYRLLRTDWAETGLTFNVYKAGANWGTAGGYNSSTDYTTTDAATSASLSAAGWQAWNVLNQVKTAFASVGGIAHFIVRDDGAAATKQQCYWSREYAVDTSLRPKLYIEYTLPSVTGAAFLLRMI